MATKPKISVCMATHEDFHGTYFTLQELKATNPKLLKDMELVVVDQSPKSAHGAEVAKQMSYAAQCCHTAKYVPYTEKVGTSHSRQKAIEMASADIFVVLDCHVVMMKDAIPAILDYFADPSHAKDMVQGPLLSDAIFRHEPGIEEYDERTGPWSVMATHYADHWRAEMWGTWGNAWQCPCGGFSFSTWPDGELVRFETLSMRPQFVKHCQACNKRFPMLGWSGHEVQLRNLGYIELSHTEKPFEIPAQGLGMFAMRKEAWPGFNPNTWGFGGEELWIHEKVRMSGGKCVCHPLAKWYHRFPRPEMAKYPNTTWYKARNYVVEFNELGWNLDPIKSHFVDGGKVASLEWDAMSSDPLKFVHGPTEQFQQPVMVNGQPANVMKVTAESVYEKFKSIPRDLNQHMPMLRELASECESVCEFSKRRESAAVWIVSGAKKVELHNLELQDGDLRAAVEEVKDRVSIKADNGNTLQINDINDCDLLFFDSVHHADRLRTELSKFAKHAKKYIVFRGTANFGMEAEGGGPGLFEAIRDFVTENPEWFCTYHSGAQYGMTVISCDPSQKPDKPVIPWPPGKGPGTELKRILEDLGIKVKAGCTCGALQVEMDKRGPEGCEEHFDSLIERIKANAKGWGWVFIGAAYKALTSGLWREVSPLDPIPDLVRLAIKRAKEKRDAFEGKAVAA